MYRMWESEVEKRWQGVEKRKKRRLRRRDEIPRLGCTINSVITGKTLFGSKESSTVYCIVLSLSDIKQSCIFHPYNPVYPSKIKSEDKQIIQVAAGKFEYKNKFKRQRKTKQTNLKKRGINMILYSHS